jgi:peroxiredoxin
MKFIFLAISVNLFCCLFSSAQKTASSASKWRAIIHRQDENNIVFNFEKQQKNHHTVLYVLNAGERLRVDSVRFTGDSVFIKMPVFESSFKAKIKENKWSGVWIKGTAGAEQVMPLTAEKNKQRFALTEGLSKSNLTGRWAVKFANDKPGKATSIAEFKQKGNKLEGTFLTPTGDYRFLEGVVTGNKLKMSGFDGGHAYLFTANVTDKNTIEDGQYYSGPKYAEGWSALKNANAKVETDEAAMFLKPGEEKLNFRFPDLNGNPVSIEDEHFKNKVVIVQLMGSWCPNCMDETAFLSDYYSKNKQRGVEMIALAYEYSTDFERSQKSLKKFQQRFNVQYPVLITGVTVSDSLRTEKTLPQVTNIKVFPSSIIIDKKGKVRKLDTGFFGPGTGAHYETYKKEFYETVNKLLDEK